MGCIAVESAKSIKQLTNEDFRLVWNWCLKLQSIKINHKIKYTHPCFAQIDKDVDRTFPQHPFFEKAETKKSFERILKAFALEFPKVGYTQGLNFVVGFLLIAGLSQQKALKAIIGLCTNGDLMLLGLYQDEFPLCRLYCSVFWQVAGVVCPQASKLLITAGLKDEFWLFQWFITLFIYSLPLCYIQDIFTFIIVKRYFACVRIAVAILQSLQKHLASIQELNQEALIECFELIKTQQFCLKHIPLENILKQAEKIKKTMIMKLLQKNQCKNWYSNYFMTWGPHQQKKYKSFIKDLDDQRLLFEQDNNSNVDRYSRQYSSIRIIDFVQENKHQRFSHAIFGSNKQKNQFMSTFSDKIYNSLTVINSIEK